tara:strand:+ start:294 stop:404 length:111 start_codon:yes stop_codon:yes gene_type:complete
MTKEKEEQKIDEMIEEQEEDDAEEQKPFDEDLVQAI